MHIFNAKEVFKYKELEVARGKAMVSHRKSLSKPYFICHDGSYENVLRVLYNPMRARAHTQTHTSSWLTANLHYVKQTETYDLKICVKIISVEQLIETNFFVFT